MRLECDYEWETGMDLEGACRLLQATTPSETDLLLSVLYCRILIAFVTSEAQGQKVSNCSNTYR
jgi:hypothetical protein